MKIIVVGCGNAFSYINYHQSYLLEENGKRLLIDCGTRIPLALHRLKIPITSIEAIYISHAHSDHIGGLEEVAFLRYDWKKRPRKWDDYRFNGRKDHRDYIDTNIEYEAYAPRLIANERLLEEIWQFSLKGGLDSMEGFDSTLETFFEPMPIKANVPFYWEGWQFDLIQQIHIMTGSIIKYTFGLLVSKKDHKTIYFTTDSQHCSPRQMEIFYKKADIIFQDCECIGVDTTKKLFLFGSGVHANYAQLAGYDSANSIKLPLEIKAKMLLSHYQDFVMHNKDNFGNDCSWEQLAKEDGFRGFAHVGHVLEV